MRSLMMSHFSSLTELKDKILSLAHQNPGATGLAVRKMLLSRDSSVRLAVAANEIGWDYARQIFDGLQSSQWAVLRKLATDHQLGWNSTPPGLALTELHKCILAETLAWDPTVGSQDPFAFIKSLGRTSVMKLFAGEDSSNIAFISAFWEPRMMTRLLSLFPPPTRKQLVLQISRLERLPNEAVTQAAFRFAKRLKEKARDLPREKRAPAATPKLEIARPKSPTPPVFQPTFYPTGPTQSEVGRAIETLANAKERDGIEAYTPSQNEKNLMDFLKDNAPEVHRELAQAGYDDLTAQLVLKAGSPTSLHKP